MNIYNVCKLICLLITVSVAYEHGSHTVGVNNKENGFLIKVSNNGKSVNERPDIVSLAQELNLTTFVSKLITTKLATTLEHEVGPFTVFAPINEAFVREPSYCKNVALKDRMKYHVTRGQHTSDSFKNDEELSSLLSHRKLRINMYNKQVITASGRQVISSDHEARNGIIHIIKDEICSIFKGGAMFEINRCPPLSIFTSAVNRTGLFSILDHEDPLTIFVPTNEAIGALPEVVKMEIWNNETLLKKTVLNHVVPLTMYSAGLYNGQSLKSLAGEKLKISVTKDSIIINKKAAIVLPDATVQNGAVHSIDGVLIPSDIREAVSLSTNMVF